MEPPMSNSSMRHPDPDLDFDDTRIILQGASCTIAAVEPVSALQGAVVGPLARAMRLDESIRAWPPQILDRGRGGDFDVERLYMVFPMKSTYQYLPIYVDLIYMDFPLNSTYRYRYLKPRISQRTLNLV
jgi:hypothetical protein